MSPKSESTQIDPEIIRTFQNSRIGVIVAGDEPGMALLRDLQRTRAQIDHIWPIPDELPTTYDILYCQAEPGLPRRLPNITAQPKFGFVLVMRPLQNSRIDYLENCVPHAVVHLPVTQQAVYSSLIMARNLRRYESRLRRRIDKLDENLRTMRRVERAKAILMKNRSISESEAYSYLRKQAMNKQTSIGVLANAIIDSHELLK